MRVAQLSLLITKCIRTALRKNCKKAYLNIQETENNDIHMLFKIDERFVLS